MNVSNCFHCSLPIPDGAEFTAEAGGVIRRFCCNGCRAVCLSIFKAGLEGFYAKSSDRPIAPPPPPPKDLDIYDMEEVAAHFVSENGETMEANLLIEGIHCAACVWLIERSLQKMEGVHDAKVNLSARRLKVSWNRGATRLSRIIETLASVGYAAVPYDPERAEGSAARRKKAYLFRIAFAGFAMMNLLWISVALYGGADRGEFRQFFHWLGFILATPTILYSGYPCFQGALGSLRGLHLNMDLPIAIGAAVTYLYSVYVTFNPLSEGEVYFDTVVTFIFVILIGRYLETASRDKAASATRRLMDLQPKVATLFRDGREEVVPVAAVKGCCR